MIPTITTGTLIDDPTFSTDYKSDIDIDMHVPTNTLDTDYRPNFDGMLICITINYIIYNFLIYIYLYFRFIC